MVLSKNPMDKCNDNQKIDPTDAIEAFFGCLGKSDIYTQIVLEEFFKELFNEQSEELPLHIFSQTEQEGHKSN